MRLLFFSILHPPSCREGTAVAVPLWRRLDLPLAKELWQLRKSQTLKREALGGVAVGEAVKAEEGAEGEPLQRRRLLPLRQAAMSETRRWSSSCSCAGAFTFPRRSRG